MDAYTHGHPGDAGHCPICDATTGRSMMPPMPERLSEERLRELEMRAEYAEDGWDVLEVGIQPEDVLALITEARRARRLEAALRTIRGPADDPDPYMGVYRAAGGGYEGLQAIAAAALADEPPSEGA